MAFNKYQVIKGAVSYELANFVFNYFLLKRDAVKFMYDNNLTYDKGMLGTWTDQQIIDESITSNEKRNWTRLMSNVFLCKSL